eukprot:7800518-Pyramimonas_sp.AAC.1
MRQPPPSTALAPCASPIQYSASWPHRGLHRRSQWDRPHAPTTTQISLFIPAFHPPTTALRGPIGS